VLEEVARTSRTMTTVGLLAITREAGP